MIWFWKKKDEPAKEPEIKTDPKPTMPEVDDWIYKTSDWAKKELCHCGQAREWFSPFTFSSGHYDVCPKCGHEDKWETFVAREVWEESPARFKFFNYPTSNIWLSKDKWERNRHVERWTQEHCPIKGEE